MLQLFSFSYLFYVMQIYNKHLDVIGEKSHIVFFGYWLLAIGYWLLAIGYWLLANYQLSIVHC